MEGEKGILLSPNRAVFAAICGVLSSRDEQRKQELLGLESYKIVREMLKNNDLQVVAEQLRKEHFPTTEEFQSRHYFGNGAAVGILRMVAQELAGISFKK